jgi:hypothetical protein
MPLISDPGGNYAYWPQAAQPNKPQANQLAQQYVNAKTEDEKKEAQKKLSEMLGKQFDQHVQQQQKELEDLEKQIASLRTLLKKRMDAKTTIVDRRFEQLVQEAQGLGWPGPATPRYSNPTPVPVPPGVPPAPAKKHPRE